MAQVNGAMISPVPPKAHVENQRSINKEGIPSDQKNSFRDILSKGQIKESPSSKSKERSAHSKETNSSQQEGLNNAELVHKSLEIPGPQRELLTTTGDQSLRLALQNDKAEKNSHDITSKEKPSSPAVVLSQAGVVPQSKEKTLEGQRSMEGESSLEGESSALLDSEKDHAPGNPQVKAMTGGTSSDKVLSAQPQLVGEVTAKVSLKKKDIPKRTLEITLEDHRSPQRTRKSEPVLSAQNLRGHSAGPQDSNNQGNYQNTQYNEGADDFIDELRTPQEGTYSPQGGGGKVEIPVSNMVARSFQEHMARSGNTDLVRNIKFILKDNSAGEIKLILKPESLGNVRITLNMQENNIAGRIIVDNQSIKDVFLNNMNQL
ncbi:MAG: flagellar hook-length control protein FliK, partial [Spirochaetaceae bacterium]|nr:flagellar hook-length control protein FliK [Spirochaetaceae bacterium]